MTSNWLRAVRLLVISNGLWPSGAQISANEFLALISDKVEIKVLSCIGGRYALNPPRVEVHRLSLRKVGALITMDLDSVAVNLIKWADVVWIATSEFALAPEVKRVKSVPVIAHLHSYELICPRMWFCYGLREPCQEGCSLLRSVECEQECRRVLLRTGILSGVRAWLRWSLNFTKSPLNYLKWRQLIGNILNSIDGYVAVSNALRDLYVKHVRHLEKSITVVYNPDTTTKVREARPRRAL